MPRDADETSRHPLRRVFASPAFRRLWAVGAIANAMRWVEILVAAVFTFEVTGSAFAVSVVAMLRALPMLLAGAVAGAIAEVLDRRRLLMAGQAAVAASGFTIAGLSFAGALQVWHLGAAGLLAGLVWTGEMASRRRMLTEAAGERDMVQAMALDTLTSNTTRMAGPLLGGLLYESVGIGAAYALAGCCYLTTFVLLSGVRLPQARRALRPRQVLLDVAEGIATVRRLPVLQAVVLATVAMNVFAFSFTTVLPALGTLAYGATPLQIGLLTAAEPAGALLAGLVLATRRAAPLSALAMLAGCGGFMLALLLLPLMPLLWLAVGLLLLGGCGSSLFAALQTALAVTAAPPEARSRVLGLVTTCIGTGPFGVLLMGALADALGPRSAIPIIAAAGLALLVVGGAVTLRRR
ncbi:MFS transporter [Siccirubricoccus deserti]|uniref:MFS transporter n=1 Tax=Siccirubricoccus deserti TaxID=2013562 RepID=A0A9X0R361_9PROT|nr:MFS transporter [Siccirubricoccus deserti]MBC4018480.1 MFS transporter [Siccirubricoccus deserti]GGC65824.1 MFS transporter [Siccirubricoccus deserti]